MDHLLQVNRNEFQEEQNTLLKTLLEARFFGPWKQGYNDRNPHNVPIGGLELFLTSACNQRCEYCYLINHPELYPKEVNNRKTIIKNLYIFLDWALSNEFTIPMLDLFSGEIWHTDFGLEVLDILYDYKVNKGLQLMGIMIPSNCSFVHDDKTLYEIQNRINAFYNAGVILKFSISVDGKIVEDEVRPLNDGTTLIKDDVFYERLFNFAKHNGYGFHPMIAAASISKWIENFEWWKSMLHKYDLPLDFLMMLEVRNDDWSEENLQDLKAFMAHLVDDVITYHNGKLDDIVDDLLSLNITYQINHQESQLWGRETSYTPFTFGDDRGFYGCTISSHLTVRLGDLAILPCHRLGYNQQVYGYFKVENDTIVDIVANNPHLAIHILMTDKRFSTAGCDSCVFRGICFGCCKGQSRESTGDPIHNDPKVCNFLKRKHTDLFEIYEERGIMQWMEENISEYHTAYTTLKIYLDVYKRFKEARDYGKLEAHRQDFYW